MIDIYVWFTYQGNELKKKTDPLCRNALNLKNFS